MWSQIALTVSVCLALVTTAPGASFQQKPAPDAALTAKLLSAKRIYVDSLGDDRTSRAVQAMIINALSQSKRFIVTENRDKADAILKGTAIQRSTQELHATSEGTSVASVAGAGSATAGGAVAAIAGLGTAIQDSAASTETIDHAELAVPQVSSDGDTIWTATQERRGSREFVICDLSFIIGHLTT